MIFTDFGLLLSFRVESVYYNTHHCSGLIIFCQPGEGHVDCHNWLSCSRVCQAVAVEIKC